ncbi:MULTISPECIES: hypothetical protein [Cohnella]|uniref:hypothetical protein n=1 Tax=Cohnella TaxID=329857 RepID=UPI001967B74E|nr:MULTISPECIES: hypothetical protein [Cohnella]MBN2980351.1 hypothetical protein [Cohnella algarum]
MISLHPDRKKQLDYVGITDRDLSMLHGKENEFNKVADRLVDELYRRISAIPELTDIMAGGRTKKSPYGRKRRRSGFVFHDD